jgi:hypothetical protein
MIHSLIIWVVNPPLSRLFDEQTAQRLALPAWGGRVDSLSKREKLEAAKNAKKRGAYPKSGARCVGLLSGL